MIVFRVYDKSKNGYIFEGMTVDKALREITAFLSQDMLYELRSELKDIRGNYIYHGDIVQNGDTVEVLEICRELPRFDKSLEELIGSKHRVKEVDDNGDIKLANGFYFTSRQVAKCEPEKAQSIQSEEQFGDTIVFNGRTYKAI